jgi:acetyltransferase-like isoleucine patch superfamily enzyme
MIFEEHVKVGNVKVKSSSLEIGAFSYLRSGTEVYGPCEIGRFCSVGQNVIIGLEKNKHPTNWLSTSLFSKRQESLYATDLNFVPTKIGNDCWIGRDAVIMSGVKIGNGAIIGARAVVTSNVPSYAIYGGIPAKLIRYRFSDPLIKKIEVSNWWNYSLTTLVAQEVNNPVLCIENLANSSSAILACYKKILVTKKGIRPLKNGCF